jgi:hypothetical protein
MNGKKRTALLSGDRGNAQWNEPRAGRLRMDGDLQHGVGTVKDWIVNSFERVEVPEGYRLRDYADLRRKVTQPQRCKQQ